MRYGILGLMVLAACGGDDSAVDVDAAAAADGAVIADAVIPDAEVPDAVPPSPLGEACSDGATCASGFCADGVCCDTACGPFTCGAEGACPTTCGVTAECSDDAACVAGACESAKWAFTTSTTSNGNLGGIFGGDAMCQGLADAAGLGGTYLAWLATDTFEPASRFTHPTVAYVMPAPGDTAVQLADDWTDLTDGTIDAPFDHTELGGTVPGNIPYTNALASGLRASTTSDCAEWTSSNPALQGASGSSLGTDEGIWSYSNSTGCNVLHRLFCFEQ